MKKLTTIMIILASISCTDEIIDVEPTYDFRTVKIGEQLWMVDNLNVATFKNGDPITEAQDNWWIKDNEPQIPYWSYFDNEPANGAKYGKLYNGYAVMDSREMCPDGWRIATSYDWDVLVDYLGEDAGTQMKSMSGWDRDGNGTNISGFNALPGGFRNAGGTFFSVGVYSVWWTASTGARALSFNDSRVSPTENVRNKGQGYYVRCIKN